MFARHSVFGGTVCVLMLLSGCNRTPPPVVGTMAVQPVEADNQTAFAAPPAADYRLEPADVVAINVFREPDLSLANTPVGSDGMIAVPLIGSIRAAGLTTSELAANIESALGKGYLTHPRVAVNVMQYTSHRVTVEGAVAKPGVYEFVPGERLSSAIAQAEGPTRVARLEQIAVFRPTAEGMSIAKFDYRAMEQGTMIDPVLRPGDRVVVGTSGLSQFWQDLLRALPSFALFTQLGNL